MKILRDGSPTYIPSMGVQTRAISVRSVAPLTQQEHADARAIAERLAVEVSRLMAHVEGQYRNAFALSRFLGVERTTCQRLLSSVSTVDERTVARGPGAKALLGLIAAMARKGIDAAIIAGFQDVASRLERFFEAVGGTQQAFSQRLLLSQQLDHGVAKDRGEQPEDATRRMFDAACEIVGRWSDVQTQIAIIRPSVDKPGMADVARSRGLIAHVQQLVAAPLVFTHLYGTSDANLSQYRELRKTEDPPTFLLNEFCSPNWRISNFVDSDSLIQPIEVEPNAIGKPGDLITGSVSIGLSRDPRFESPPLQEVFAAVDIPTRRLVLDVYLHKDLARLCKGGADVHAPRQADPSFVRQTHRRWMTRLGQPTQLAMLGAGTEASDYPPYSRHRQVTETMFELVQWKAREFVGFRLDVAYPVWRTCMRAFFSFEDVPTKPPRGRSTRRAAD